MAADTLQLKVQAILQLRDKPAELVCALKTADPDTLYALISRTGYTGSIGAEYEAVRETALAIHQARLSADLIGSMTKLNSSTTILYWVGLAVAAIIGIAQIVIPLVTRR